MRSRPGYAWRVLVCLSLSVGPAAFAGAPAGAGVLLPAPQQAAAGPRAAHQTEHFLFRYDPGRLSAPALDAAVAAAEAGYARCTRVFPVGRLGRRVTIDLSPSFLGASGYADPAGHRISIRVADLEYLGLDLSYVMAHEVAHVFTHAELAARGCGSGLVAGPWSEGMADYATGGFGDIPLADWWGPALRASGLWADPRWLIEGGSAPNGAEFVCERTSTYEQAALFIRYLVGEYGSDAVHRFYAEYATACARRDAERRELRPPGEPVSVDGVFRAHFSASGEALLERWLERLTAAAVPAEPAARLSLPQRIYGSLRQFEMAHARALRRGTADAAAAAAIRDQFRLANESLRGGDLPAAKAHLARALRLAQPPPERPAVAVTLWNAPERFTLPDHNVLE